MVHDSNVLHTDRNGAEQEAYRNKYAGELKRSKDCFTQIQMVEGEVQNLKTVLDKTAAALEGKGWCKELMPHLSDILTELDCTLKSLQHPCLKIAFVGTTASGKSTLLNGLEGHRIAPMEAGEMSAGVVRVRNGNEVSLVVHPTDNMVWPEGPYEVKNDEDMYRVLRDNESGIMDQYRKAAKKNAEVMAPHIEITVQLAPKNGGIPQFEMPPSIGLEFYDLPGLKSVTDSKNLRVIQEHLSNSFLLIVLDYNETDSEKRKKLMDEIKKTVQDICHNKENLLFVLNKVDEWNSESNPLREYIDALKKDIGNILELADPPEIISMSALPLYHVQTAWGAEKEPIYNKSVELAQKSREQLAIFFIDCAKIVKRISIESEEKRAWFRNHDETNIAEWKQDDMLQLLHWVYEYSGAYRFWKTLQRKLNEQIGPIIINPALGRLPAHLRDFSGKLTDLAGILTISTHNDIQGYTGGKRRY